jgi:hypothetical protein
MSKSKKMIVKDTEITIIREGGLEFISLTDMTKGFDNGGSLIDKWMRNKNTLEYLSVWEVMHNEDFNSLEFEGIKNEAGLNRFAISIKQWAEKTNAIGIISKAGRYGGTYAHKDIAYHFAMWLSPEFQILIVKEFDRLKENEAKYLNQEWDYRRFLSKVNYRIQTDSIKDNIIPSLNLGTDKEWLVYAAEADILNYAVFEMTAKQWKEQFPDRALQGRNIRDFADIHQLTVLANLENYNSILIKERKDKHERLLKLRKEAHEQLTALKKTTYTIGSIKSPFILIEQDSINKGEK